MLTLMPLSFSSDVNLMFGILALTVDQLLSGC